MTANLIVTGATGLVGGEVIRRLSARGVAVRALARSPERAAAISALPGVTVVYGDLARPESLAEPLRGVTRALLISTSAPDMQQVQTSFVAAAKTAGVAHVVKLSGILPDVDSPFRFARMHGEVERALAASGLAFTNLRAGEFMHSYFRQVRPIVDRGVLALPMADARIASIDVGDLAEVAVATLTGAGHEGQSYPLTGSEALTMAEVAAELSRATGKTIRYVDVPPADARAARLAAGMPPYLAEGLDELFAERRAGKEGTVSPAISTVFGVRPTTFAEFAARHAAVFRGEQPPPAS